jgi:hypothetical protein
MLDGDLRLRQGGQRKKRRGQPGGQRHATEDGHGVSLSFGWLLNGTVREAKGPVSQS